MTTKQEQALNPWFKQFDRSHHLSVFRQLAAVGLMRCLSLVFLLFALVCIFLFSYSFSSSPVNSAFSPCPLSSLCCGFFVVFIYQFSLIVLLGGGMNPLDQILDLALQKNPVS